MFICNECGCTFGMPAARNERTWHEEVGCYEYQHYEECPECGSTDFDEADGQEDDE